MKFMMYIFLEFFSINSRLIINNYQEIDVIVQIIVTHSHKLLVAVKNYRFVGTMDEITRKRFHPGIDISRWARPWSLYKKHRERLFMRVDASSVYFLMFMDVFRIPPSKLGAILDRAADTHVSISSPGHSSGHSTI